MDYGIVLPNYGPLATTANIRHLTLRAEALGYRAVWLTDHVLVPEELNSPYEHIYEILTTLSYLAGITSRIQLGTSIVVLPQRDPILVAKQAATLDQLSHGRVWLGVGIGWMAREFGFLRAPFRQRGRRMDAWIDVMQALWRGERSYGGEEVAWSEAAFSPLPVRAGGIPLYIAGSSMAALRRTARVGAGWHPVGSTPDEMRAGVATLRALTERELHITLRQTVDMRDDAARPAPGARFRITGPPEKVAVTLAAYEAAGVNHLAVGFGAESADAFEQQMAHFAAAFIL